MTQYDLALPLPYYVGQPSGVLPYAPHMPPAQGHQQCMPQLGDRPAAVLAITDEAVVTPELGNSPPKPAETPVPAAPAEIPVPAPAEIPAPA
eukprot:11722537-Karenia_brevis.AAC.1